MWNRKPKVVHFKSVSASYAGRHEVELILFEFYGI